MKRWWKLCTDNAALPRSAKVTRRYPERKIFCIEAKGVLHQIAIVRV